MLTEWLLLFAIALITYAFYCWATQDKDFFTKRGIEQMQPVFLLGNSAPFITRKLNAAEYATRLYNAFPNER